MSQNATGKYNKLTRRLSGQPNALELIAFVSELAVGQILLLS